MSAAREHGLRGVPDAGVFLTRLTRLDPGAVVRLRSAGEHTVLWAPLPWQALVTRAVAGPGPGDVTVGAAALLAELIAGGPALPPARDADWRWPLPPARSSVVQSLAAAELSRLAAAAAGTLRTAASQGVSGRAVGQRVLRDALLDHVALVVTEPERVEVSQRLVQAVTRMGFLGPGDRKSLGDQNGPGDQNVQIRRAGPWTAISAPYGIAWLRTANKLVVRPIAYQPKG